MEKRLLLAIAMSVLVLVAWGYLFPPPERPPAVVEPAPMEDALADEAAAAAEPLIDEPLESQPPGEAIAAEAVEEHAVSTEFFDVRLTNQGGRALYWGLKGFADGNGEPLALWPRYQDSQQLPLGIELDDPALTRQLNDALYRMERASLPDAGQGSGERITYVWSDGTGLEVRKAFTFWQRSYLVGVELEVTDRGRRRNARMALGPGFSAQEKREGRSSYYYSSQSLWNIGGQVTRRPSKKLDEEGGFAAGVKWVGLEDQFFAALLLPDEERARVQWRMVERTPELATDAADADPPEKETVPILSVTLGAEGGRLFVGPKQYTLLRGLGDQLELAVWFSSQVWLAWIVRHIYLGLLWIHAHVTSNYGLAIMLATVALRLVLFPVNQYSMVRMKHSQLQMQRLQPKVKAIRAKYKKQKDAESRARMNQEMMDLYKREGVNPMGGVTGCLPLFAQFPILIGFYNMLTVAVELRGAPFFGWIQDLSVKDPYWITPLLMGATMFAQQKMSMSRIKDPQQLQQQRMMLFMPIMFTVICLQMPAGLVLYWFVNNVLGIGQQWLVNRHTARLEDSHDVGDKGAKDTAGVRGKGSGRSAARSGR